MNFFKFQEDLMSKTVLDDGENSVDNARKATPPAPHGMNSSAKVIAEFSDKDRILSADEIIEHRKHCRAKPGNCPFEKARDEADDISPKDIKITKQTVFNRFAMLLTQMFTMSKNLAKPAIVNAEKIDAKIEPSKGGSFPQSNTAQDEAPQETNTDAKMVAEIIESGIERMVEMAKTRGCTVNMDEKNTKYIVTGPTKETKQD